jgi:glucose-6-phosphate 1-epimerase
MEEFMSSSDELSPQSLTFLNIEFGHGSHLYFQEGASGLPKLCLHLPEIGSVEMYLKGAHVTSWIPDGKDEVFYLSKKSHYDTDSIRGGIPIIFPKFGGRNLPDSPILDEMIPHGFARHEAWRVIDTSINNEETGTVVLELTHSPQILPQWPEQRFTLRLHVTLSANSLLCELQLINNGASPLIFRGGFHPYFGVSDLSNIGLGGLQGLSYEDAFDGFTLKGSNNKDSAGRDAGEGVNQQDTLLAVGEPLNRVYLETPNTFELRDKERGSTLYIKKSGFPEVVLWSPEPSYCREKTDMESDDYKTFICIEPAIASTAITVPSEEQWKGTMHLALD